MKYAIVYLDRRHEVTTHALSYVYNLMEEQALLSTVFYDDNPPDRESFVSEMTAIGSFPFVMLGDGDPVLFSWLNGAEGRCIRIHFTMFKHSWGGKRNATSLARHFISYVLTRKDHQGFLFDTLIGLTPVSNALACRFVQRAGMASIGILPHGAFLHAQGRSVDAMMTAATRENLGIESTVEGIWNA